MAAAEICASSQPLGSLSSLSVDRSVACIIKQAAVQDSGHWLGLQLLGSRWGPRAGSLGALGSNMARFPTLEAGALLRASARLSTVLTGVALAPAVAAADVAGISGWGFSGGSVLARALAGAFPWRSSQ